MNAWRMGVALLVMAAPLAGQQPGAMAPQGQMTGHMMAMQEMMGPMMRIMVYAPDHLLGRKDVLGLTEQQVARLTALRDAAKAAHDGAAADAKAHGDALALAFAAPAPDTAALRLHFDGMHAAMGRAHVAMLRAAAQAKAVLTDTQRARVEGWADAMGQMGPMMQHHQ